MLTRRILNRRLGSAILQESSDENSSCLSLSAKHPPSLSGASHRLGSETGFEATESKDFSLPVSP